MTAEQKLREAAEKYKNSTANKMSIERLAFIQGAKSEAAKEWHQQWIPVSERKPENRDRTLVWVKEHKELGGQPLIAFYTERGFEVLFRDIAKVSGCVTHWTPLHSPPDI